MLYIHDITGYKGDFGTRLFADLMNDIAIELNLDVAIDFFKEGFIIEPNKLVEELGSIKSDFSEIEEALPDIIEAIKKCEEIAILTEGNE